MKTKNKNDKVANFGTNEHQICVEDPLILMMNNSMT